MNEDGIQGAAQTGRPFGHGGDDGDGGDGRADAGDDGSRGEHPVTPNGWALISRAVMDYLGGDTKAAVLIVSDAEDVRLLPAAHFFRTAPEMPLVEQEALRLARGRVLDIGAGAGAHALALQEMGLEVTATEVGEDAAAVMRVRGVEDVRVEDIFSEAGQESWDTILLLMNGTTLVGSGHGLVRLLSAAAARMAEGGCILIDSTDLTEDELTEDDSVGAGQGEIGAGADLDGGAYVGEVQLQIEYLGAKSAPFPVLYADPDLMKRCSAAAGLKCEVACQGGAGSYLAKLTRE